MGIIMTGMGADMELKRVLRAITREGGLTVGQDEASCSVYGMPRSCAEMGLVQRVVPLPRPAADSPGHQLPSRGINWARRLTSSSSLVLIFSLLCRTRLIFPINDSVENGLCKYNPSCL